jgi:hypothetical protein
MFKFVTLVRVKFIFKLNAVISVILRIDNVSKIRK